MAKNKYSYTDFIGIDGALPYADIYDKKAGGNYYIRYDLARSLNMFEWSGLPDTIPARNLEMLLQVYGYAGICKVDEQDGGGVWALYGSLGGTPTRYYMPSLYVVANPTLHRAYNFPIWYKGQEDSYKIQGANAEKCVVIANDSSYIGLYPMYARYASLLVENDISLIACDILARCQYAITATDDTTKRSAEKFIDDLIKGKLSVMADNDFIESIRTLPLTQTGISNTMTNLIEYQQYLKASKFNEIGLNANYNMKRESINADEAQMNNDALIPLAHDMLLCRQKGAEFWSELFNTEITVKLNSIWEQHLEEVEHTIEVLQEDPAELVEDPADDIKEDVAEVEDNAENTD